MARSQCAAESAFALMGRFDFVFEKPDLLKHHGCTIVLDVRQKSSHFAPATLYQSFLMKQEVTSMRRFRFGAAVLIIVLSFSWCVFVYANSGQIAIASYEEGVVTVEDMQKFWSQKSNLVHAISSATGNQQVIELAREIVFRKILLAYAEQNGLDKARNFQLWEEQNRQRRILQELLEQEVVGKLGEPTDEEVRNFYDTHPELFSRPECFSMRHVFVNASDATEEHKLNALEVRAQEARAWIAQGSDVYKVALEYSDSENNKGEIVRDIPVGNINPALEQAALSLEVGEISDCIRTRHGFEVLKLEDHKEAFSTPFERNEPFIRSRLRDDQEKILRAELLETVKEKTHSVPVQYHLENINDLETLEDQVVCRIGDDFEVKGDQLKALMYRMGKGKPVSLTEEQAREFLAEHFVLKQLYFEHAKHLGIPELDSVKRHIAVKREQMLAFQAQRHQVDKVVFADSPTDEQLRTYYEQHPHEFNVDESLPFEEIKAKVKNRIIQKKRLDATSGLKDLLLDTHKFRVDPKALPCVQLHPNE